MRAVAIAEDRTLQPTTMEERALGPSEARVAVAFCGICGSDLHLRHSTAVAAGSVMGHEFSGTVSELGAAVEGFSVGDRVAVYPFASCGECPNCLRGDFHVCANAASTGLGLGMNPGGYAESVVVDGSMLVALPDQLSFEHGALVEPLAVGLHAIDLAEAKRGDACAVIGAGPIGVVTALGLKARGIDRVVVVERNERRQERMRALGVETVGLDDVHMRVVEALGGQPPDVVFECAGNPAVPQLAAELVRSKGIIVLLGVLEEPVEISQLVLIVKEAQMRAAFAYTRKDFDDAVQLLASGDLPADSLITGTAPLERAQEMFERLESPATEDVKIPPFAGSLKQFLTRLLEAVPQMPDTPFRIAKHADLRE